MVAENSTIVWFLAYLTVQNLLGEMVQSLV